MIKRKRDPFVQTDNDAIIIKEGKRDGDRQRDHVHEFTIYRKYQAIILFSQPFLMYV